MRRLNMVVFFIFFFYAVKGQEAFSITYERLYGNEIDNPNTITSKHFTKAIFNDSIFFGYHYNGIDNVIKKNEIYGSKISHHSQWFNSHTDELYDGVAWPNRKKPYMVRKSPIVRNWVIDTTTIFFHDEYKCQKAYFISVPGDTLFAIYTSDITYPYSYYVEKGLPGVMLTIYNPRNDLYIKAIKVEKGRFLIGVPKDPRITDHFSQ